MPVLEKLRRHHDLLTEHEAAALQLASVFARASQPLRDAHIPAGTLAALEADLIYALIRHQRWLSAPLAAAVIADFIASDFALARPLAAGLAAALVPVAANLIPQPQSHVVATDEEFLRAVCIATATADSETELLLDLGLGGRLLSRLKESVKQLAVGDGSTARFVSELDAQIGAIVCDLSREQKTLPWSLQIHRLRLHLSGIGAPWRDLIAEHGAKWLFDLLLALASRGAMSDRQVSAKLSRVLPEFTDVPSDDFCDQLMTALAAFALCYSDKSGGTTARWRPLPLAQAVTAEAYSRQRLNTPGCLWADLPTLNPHYQAALLRLMPDFAPEPLELWLSQPRPLPPLALAAALTRLAESEGQTVPVATIEQLWLQQASPWSRKATADALQLMPFTLPIGQFLAQMAKSDASPQVQVAALKAALRHGAVGTVRESAVGDIGGNPPVLASKRAVTRAGRT